ncbi:hypothetical protein BJ742DRAFT_811648 [Cladochytrium replicatum]|nr:hypothetical protein BJ742DRAFT_811648 [Cladochytrium replicatum]
MKVLIVGAGVGGPVLALLLKKAGHDPVIVDKFDPANLVRPKTNSNGKPAPLDFGDVGGGFTLAHGPLMVLRDLGLLHKVRKVSFNETERLVWSRMDGTEIYHWDAVAHKFDDELKYTAQILRSTLHRIIMAEIGEQEIPVTVGKSLHSVDTSNPDKVVAHFTDGTSIGADILVGADGMHSSVRRAVFGDNLHAKPDLMVGYLGVTTYDEKDRWVKDGGYVNFYAQAELQKRLVLCRVSDTQVFWEITEYGTREDTDDHTWHTTTSTALPAEVGRLAESLKSWGAPQGIVDLIARSHRLTPLNIYDAPRLDSFSKGRVVLIGDSAHGMPPHLGQGLTLAYGDAGVLAEAMTHFKDEYRRAFEIYNKLRVPHAHSMSDRTHGFAEQNFPTTTFARWTGEFTMKASSMLFNYLNLISVMSTDCKAEVNKAIGLNA